MSFKRGNLEIEVYVSSIRTKEVFRYPNGLHPECNATGEFIKVQAQHLLSESGKLLSVTGFYAWVDTIQAFINKDLAIKPFVYGVDTSREYWVGVACDSVQVGTWDNHPFSGIRLPEKFPGGICIITIANDSFKVAFDGYSSQVSQSML